MYRYILSKDFATTPKELLGTNPAMPEIPREEAMRMIGLMSKFDDVSKLPRTFTETHMLQANTWHCINFNVFEGKFHSELMILHVAKDDKNPDNLISCLYVSENLNLEDTVLQPGTYTQKDKVSSLTYDHQSDPLVLIHHLCGYFDTSSSKNLPSPKEVENDIILAKVRSEIALPPSTLKNIVTGSFFVVAGIAFLGGLIASAILLPSIVGLPLAILIGVVASGVAAVFVGLAAVIAGSCVMICADDETGETVATKRSSYEKMMSNISAKTAAKDDVKPSENSYVPLFATGPVVQDVELAPGNSITPG